MRNYFDWFFNLRPIITFFAEIATLWGTWLLLYQWGAQKWLSTRFQGPVLLWSGIAAIVLTIVFAVVIFIDSPAPSVANVVVPIVELPDALKQRELEKQLEEERRRSKEFKEEAERLKIEQVARDAAQAESIRLAQLLDAADRLANATLALAGAE